MEHLRIISITHTDVGATLHTVIRIGDTVVASYMPGTRHVETAEKIADDILHRVFTPLFDQALAEENVTVVPEDFRHDNDEIYLS